MMTPNHSSKRLCTVVNGITVQETQYPVQLVEFENTERIFLNTKYTTDFRIRPVIREMIEHALTQLPDHLGFVIYEALRPRERQLLYWKEEIAKQQLQHPEYTEEQIVEATELYIANPYKLGSGHQTGVAIDITLCTLDGTELDMGSAMHELTKRSNTNYTEISEESKANRALLKSILEAVSLINYQYEWWHFSFGDRLWAEVTGRNYAFFYPIDGGPKEQE